MNLLLPLLMQPNHRVSLAHLVPVTSDDYSWNKPIILCRRDYLHEPVREDPRFYQGMDGPPSRLPSVSTERSMLRTYLANPSSNPQGSSLYTCHRSTHSARTWLP